MSNQYEIALGEACNSLLANPFFAQLLGEIGRRRELVVESAFFGKCESYEEYLEHRAKYQAMTELMDLPNQLAHEATMLREQTNE